MEITIICFLEYVESIKWIGWKFSFLKIADGIAKLNYLVDL
jgi:hypothetical protein